jgi:hypothetical protein
MSCGIRQTALTRSRWDDVHQADDQRISGYAGQYAFTPNRTCPTTFPVNTTLRIQQSGASWPQGMWKTDVESSLRGVGRPPTKWRADSLLYNPTTDPITNAPLVNAPDENAPLTFNRLSNPPCTLRATGWNRWESLLHDPQVNFETPFDFFIPSRSLDKEHCKTHVDPQAKHLQG